MISPDRRRREFARFLKFSVVGTIGAVVDFGTFNLLHTLLGMWSVLASVCSFCAAVFSNFIWNRYWTYPDSRSKPVFQQALQFALVNVIGLLVRTPIFALSEGPMTRLAERIISTTPTAIPPGSEGLLSLEPHVLGPNLALALAVIVVLFWNFGVNRIWTYSDVR